MLGCSFLGLWGCTPAATAPLGHSTETPRPTWRAEREIRRALVRAGADPTDRVHATGREYGTSLLYEVCEDRYLYGDRPGHPTEPCEDQDEYLVRLVDGVWTAERIEPLPPFAIDCFPYVQIWGGPWKDAEYGRPIPTPGRVPRPAMPATVLEPA